MNHCEISEHINLASNWLSQSGIRNSAQNTPIFGSFNRQYDCTHKTYDLVYNEITGYGISTLVYLYLYTGNQQHLQMAIEAADYLLSIQCLDSTLEEYGGIPHSLSLDGSQCNQQYYTFDNAMCLQGLIDLYILTNNERYLNGSSLIADWLLIMQIANGSFLAMYDAETKLKEHPSQLFAGDQGCLHAKHAIGLLKLADASGSNKYDESAKKVCDWVLSLQRENGAFWANPSRRYVFTHAHCYATEGLLYAYHILERDEFLQAALKAGEWLLQAQKSDGALLKNYSDKTVRIHRRIMKSFSATRVTDATSQVVRIWCILYSLTGDKKFLEGAKRAIAFLTTMQCLDSSDAGMRGGFYYQITKSPFRKTFSNIMPAWCTMFALQAMYYYQMMKQEGRKSVGQFIQELF